MSVYVLRRKASKNYVKNSIGCARFTMTTGTSLAKHSASTTQRSLMKTLACRWPVLPKLMSEARFERTGTQVGQEGVVLDIQFHIRPRVGRARFRQADGVGRRTTA